MDGMVCHIYHIADIIIPVHENFEKNMPFRQNINWKKLLEEYSLTSTKTKYVSFLMAQQVKNPLAMQETQEMKVCSLGQEAPLKEENDIFLP